VVDPKFATKYDRTDDELEEFFIFSVCVAGKDAAATARGVDKLLYNLSHIYARDEVFVLSPFQLIRNLTYIYGTEFGVNEHILAAELKKAGIGNYNILSRRLTKLAHTSINLRTCTPDELEVHEGIGSKTSRFFILHSRPNARVAALDTHILKWLNDQGVTAPKSTPSKGSAKYKSLELTFLQLADKLGKSPATLDLEIWNDYSRNGLTKRKVRGACQQAQPGELPPVTNR
jgi:hypothetical protein